MRALEVRRHSLTKKGVARETGSLLSGDGVRKAHDLGSELPAFSYVVTGADRRHIETAIAMGYAVDALIDWPSGYVPGVVEHHDQWSWEHPFERYAELLKSHGALRDVARAHLGHWLNALQKVGQAESALVISSGGSIEPALVAACPEADHAGWGTALHQLQGATLVFDGNRCVDITIRR